MIIPISRPLLGKPEAQSAYDTILSGWVTQGPKVAEFEDKFAQYTGSKHAVAVSNCTNALHLSLIVANIKPGDEVICPSMSFIATANAIIHAGASPVFAEVGEDYNLSAEDVKSRITSKTKAVILVHQIGMPADIDVFIKLCEDNNLKLIEDAACAVGSEYKGKKIGSHSELVCFSFHPRKVITTGDGGMITTSNDKLYNRLKLLRQHAMSVNDRERHLSQKVIVEEYSEVGYNFRMTDIQAAVGIKQLERLDTIVKDRRAIAQRYYEALKDIDFISHPKDNKNTRTNFQSYSICLKETSPVSRNKLMQKLLDKGISTRRGIMLAHKENAFANYNISLPVSKKLSDNSILLPLYVPMKDEEIDYVADCLIEAFRGYSL